LRELQQPQDLIVFDTQFSKFLRIPDQMKRLVPPKKQYFDSDQEEVEEQESENLYHKFIIADKDFLLFPMNARYLYSLLLMFLF
jgi:hypothetical protein